MRGSFGSSAGSPVEGPGEEQNEDMYISEVSDPRMRESAASPHVSEARESHAMAIGPKATRSEERPEGCE